MSATPETRHANHIRPELTVDECRQCEHERRRCRAKRKYPSRKAVDEAVAAINTETNWGLMLAGYTCPWCDGFHLTRAKPGTHTWKRVEKQRRKRVGRAHAEVTA